MGRFVAVAEVQYIHVTVVIGLFFRLYFRGGYNQGGVYTEEIKTEPRGGEKKVSFQKKTLGSQEGYGFYLLITVPRTKFEALIAEILPAVDPNWDCCFAGTLKI